MGGGDELPPFDIAGAETPETLYDRAWAHSLLRATLQHLSAAEKAAGRGGLFEALKSQLNPDDAQKDSHAEAAIALGMSGESVRQAVSRLRKRYRDCIRGRIAATLHEPDDALIDEELRALKMALLH